MPRKPKPKPGSGKWTDGLGMAMVRKERGAQKAAPASGAFKEITVDALRDTVKMGPESTEVSMLKEAEYIVRLAQAGEARIVTLGELFLFCGGTFSGDSILGTCLYVRHGPEPKADAPDVAEPARWAACTIRPNASETIAAAEAWLIKRKWKPWT